MWRTLPAAVLLLAASRLPADEPKPIEAEVTFALKVQLLLKTRCVACHGDNPKDLKSGLDLTSRDSALKGGDSGQPAIVPGKAAESPLYRAVSRNDADFAAMPPKATDKLAASDVKAIETWIDGGAPWPSAERVAAIRKAVAATGVTVKTSGGLSPEWTNRTYKPEDLWAYQPLRNPTVPNAAGANPIDAFLNARLAALGLQPAPAADRRTLIRRVTFDLTGLPPAPADVDAFVADPGPDDRAFARVIDRLLASPHYGEQMARRWLDVTRYADSAGYANDYERGSAWRYRDYVVRSFNADKPYDRFIREQIAGDEILEERMKDERGRMKERTDSSLHPSSFILHPSDLLVAVGFLRMGPWELTGMEVPKVARQRFLDDVTDVVGQAFLGHMLQCARCHDHKFDPVPTRDFYRIQAAFATTQLAERPAAFLVSENITGFDEKKYLDARRERLEAELKRIREVESAARAKWDKDNLDKKGQKPPRHEFLSPADLGMERIARKGLERLKWEYDRYEPVALSVYSGRTHEVKNMLAPVRLPKDPAVGELEVTHILPGGDPFSPKDAVAPGVLSAAGELALPTALAGRRKALADWIADPKNPLAARVMANRVWQWVMGTPLAGNPNNFGATGKKPTHPELLDWLAVEFVDSGWSVKHLVRLILMSDAYRRSSRHPDPQVVAAKDPTGTSYAVFKPRRLTAEELRDSMLAASGELNRAVGGIPVRPEIHPDVALQPRQVMGTFAPAWEPSPRPEQRHRRTLYALKPRGLRDPMLEVFNAPPPDIPCEAREVSTGAPQAFALLNGAAVRGRALVLAARLTQETKSAEEAVTQAFRLAFGRSPTGAERAACLKHCAAMTERHRGLTFERPMRPTEVVREAVEENTGGKFTFTEELPSARDFVPDLHPADVTPEVRGLMEVCLVLFNANEFLYVD
ncbi:MAG TPA: PSD1 and planctomycete cytochrome C domain-containing protein [Gemmataceae bacterium]|nr:PSD1 and planctomycete cytochrome C domain-containing protein [Gemmataceae bacterium]